MRRFTQAGQDFTCAGCGQTFTLPDDGWDPLVEAQAVLQPDEIETGEEVCDDCWEQMRRDIPEMDARYKEHGW